MSVGRDKLQIENIIYMLNKIINPGHDEVNCKASADDDYSALLVKQKAVLHLKGSFLYAIIDWFVL